MASSVGPTIVWLLLFAVPLRWLTAVYLDLLGPAHSHLNGGIHEQALEHRHGHSHSPPHGHGGLERHHHHPHDQTVVTADDDRAAIESAALEEGDAQRGFGAMFLVLVSARGALPVPRMPNCMPAGRAPILQLRFLEPLERPPRLNLA